MKEGAAHAGATVLELTSRGHLSGQGRQHRDKPRGGSAQLKRGLDFQSPDLRRPDYLTPKARQRQRDVKRGLADLVAKAVTRCWQLPISTRPWLLASGSRSAGPEVRRPSAGMTSSSDE
jgi:hypothetical protein